MKKIINRPENVVIEMCNGIVMAHPELEFDRKYKIIRKKNINKDKVTLISGGGSGHEPAHAGFVGKGMLDAAVCGDVFASPSQIQIYQAIKKTAGKKGALLVIKNYSGDMMNFRNAAYMAREDGINVDYVKVDDDIAVQDSLYTVGRRGVAGTVLVHKVAGAAAEMGMSLDEVKKVAEHAVSNVRSLGFAFSSCTVPAKGTPTFDIGDDEMEYGVGIHGEPGIRREKIIAADELAERMVKAITTDLKAKIDDSVTVLINGFGGTPLQELYILNNAVCKELDGLGIHIHRTFVGNYMTSIDMQGASVSLMKMDESLDEFIDFESEAPAFRVEKCEVDVPYENIAVLSEENKEMSYGMKTEEAFSKINNEKLSLNNMKYLVDKMGTCIIEKEVEFCELDSHAGDGDFGMSVAKGFRQLKREWDEIVANESQDIGMFLDACSIVIMEYCGGASGPIWGSAFRSAGKLTKGKNNLTLSEFTGMLQAAVTGIQVTGERSFGRGAVVGDKTLIDALVPCVDSWIEAAKNGRTFKEAFELGAASAIEGAKQTEKITARMGRAGTVGNRSIGYPDAGAYALGVIFDDLSKSVN